CAGVEPAGARQQQRAAVERLERAEVLVGVTADGDVAAACVGLDGALDDDGIGGQALDVDEADGAELAADGDVRADGERGPGASGEEAVVDRGAGEAGGAAEDDGACA